jgi:phenylalanyl-tRNA synthetase beta subunit
MKYITRLGHERKVMHTRDIIRVKRSISFFLTSPQTWTEEMFLNILWQEAGNLLEEVRLRDVYHEPFTKRVSHNYDLTILTGKHILEVKQVNPLIARIEERMLKELAIDLRGRTHGVVWDENVKNGTFRVEAQ